MAKLIKKSKCEFESGIIVKKNKQVGIPYCVWCQMNKLDLMLQQFDYLKQQPSYQAGPSLEGFKRESMFDNNRPYVEMPDTPTIDKRVNEAMAFIAETDKINEVGEINEMIDDYIALIDWCTADKFIEGECYKIIDTPMLGNPLELDPETIVEAIKILVCAPVKLEE